VTPDAFGRAHLADFLAVGAHAAEQATLPRFLRAGDSGACSWPAVAPGDEPGLLYWAAYQNAVAAHWLDWDDVQLGLPTHPGAVSFAALLAVADVAGLTAAALAERFLGAVAVAAELSASFDEHHYAAGWHPTTTIGRMAAAHAVSLALHADADAAARAVQLAAVDTGGVTDAFGSVVKPLQVGAAAGGAAVCGLLSGEVRAVPQVLRPDTKLGTILGLRRAPRLERAAAGSELVGGLRLKRYPCCYYAHPVIGAATDVSGDQPSAGGIEVHVSEQCARICRFPAPRDVNEARFSLPRLAAAATLPWRDGVLGLKDGSILERPEVEQRANEVEVVVDSGLGPFEAIAISGPAEAHVDLGAGYAFADCADIARRKVSLLGRPDTTEAAAALLEPRDDASLAALLPAFA
jgi:2-methylcitrate dehydratase PrpD